MLTTAASWAAHRREVWPLGANRTSVLQHKELTSASNWVHLGEDVRSQIVHSSGLKQPNSSMQTHIGRLDRK